MSIKKYVELLKKGNMSVDEFCDMIQLNLAFAFIIGALFGVFLMSLFSFILSVVQYGN